MRLPTRWLVPWALLMASLQAPMVHAVTFVRVADEALADQATAVAEVRILEVDPSPGATRAVSDYLVEVIDVITGELPGSPIVVRVPGGVLPSGANLRINGAPRFSRGETVVLFLKPWTDGTYKVLHLLLGAFYTAEVDSKRVAYQNLSDSFEYQPAGRGFSQTHIYRDLELFRSWLRDRSAGSVRSADYWVDDLASLGLLEKYGLITNGSGMPLRWPDFDSGGQVEFMAHESGQPGQAGGGFTEFQTALEAWTNHAPTPIRYEYGGTTVSLAGFVAFDGINAVIFGDPNGTIGEPFDCASGGILAIGGPWFTGTHTHHGSTFGSVVGGDIVTNANIECVLPGNRQIEEVFAHELGHTLGLGHSDDPDALMFEFSHNDGRGALLSGDDEDAIIFLYSETVALSSAAGLILPGFEVEVADPTGPTTFFAVRNVGGSFIDVDISYYGAFVGDMPLRKDEVSMSAQSTRTIDVRSNVTDLDVADGFANGFAIFTEAEGTTAPNLIGDYFRIDDGNDFASGNLLIRPSSFCNFRETRLVDFGSGSEFRILLNLPPTGETPAFSYTAYDLAGDMRFEGDFETRNHLTVVDAADLGIVDSFGSVLFDFTNSSGGWMSSKYSAFGQFSTEIVSACRTDL